MPREVNPSHVKAARLRESGVGWKTALKIAKVPDTYLARKTQRAQAVVLAATKVELDDHLTAYQSGGAKEAYLKEQHGGHMVRAAAVSF